MTKEQAMTSAEWLAFFARTDHEDDREIPGPYEQGANLIRQTQFEEYWD